LPSLWRRTATPPAIPWDSVWIDLKAPDDSTNVVVGRWLFYITKDKYEIQVLGKKPDLVAWIGRCKCSRIC